MAKQMQTKGRTIAAVRKGFKPADLAVFGALVIAALLVAVGIAHSGAEKIAVKTDRMAVASTMPLASEEMVTISHTDDTTRTTTLTRAPRAPNFGYGL
jgi:hypothetical protein